MKKMESEKCRLLMICLAGIILFILSLSCGMAETVRPVFEGVWSDDGVHVAIRQQDDEGYHIRIDWGDGEYSRVSEYDCRYDEQNHCLRGGGTTFDEETGETSEDRDVTLTIREAGILDMDNPAWEEGISPIEVYYAGTYEGVWKDGNQTIRINVFSGLVYCTVEEQGTGTRTEWNYCCEYDVETGNLVCAEHIGGTKIVIRGRGEEEYRTHVYDSGDAVFSIDDNGYLVWNDLTENAGEGRRYERQALYESRFTYTLRYPEKTVDARFVEPYGDMDSGFDQFSVKEAGDQVYMICTLYTDYAYPFWEEELNYSKLKTDDTWLDQIETSMEKSLGLYLSPDGSEMVEELRLRYQKNLLDFVYPEIVFDMHYPADGQEQWGKLFESMLKTLEFPPLGDDVSSLELDFFNGDQAGVEYTDIVVDEDEGPFVLHFSGKTDGFVLEQVEWDRETLTVTKATPLYSADSMSAGNALKIYGYLADVLSEFRVRWTDPWSENCFYLTQSDKDGSLHFVNEADVFESLRSHGENYADVCSLAFQNAGYPEAVICRNPETLRPLAAHNPHSIVAVFRQAEKNLLCGFGDQAGEWKLQWVNETFLNDGNFPAEIGFYGEKILRIVLPDVKKPENVVDYWFDAGSLNLISACYLENFIRDDFSNEKCVECWKCSVQGNVLSYTVSADEEWIDKSSQWEGCDYTDTSSSIVEAASIHLSTAVRITDQMAEQPPEISVPEQLKLGWLGDLRLGMPREKAEACSASKSPEDLPDVIFEEDLVDCIRCFVQERVSDLLPGVTREGLISDWGTPYEDTDSEPDEQNGIRKGFVLEYISICPLPYGEASCIFFYFDESNQLYGVELALGE